MNTYKLVMKPYWLFLDDVRKSKDIVGYPLTIDIVTALNFEDAILIVLARGLPHKIYFDHDLGEGPTGYDFAKWFGNHIMDNNLTLDDDFDFVVHSANPVGRDNIIGYMNQFLTLHRLGEI